MALPPIGENPIDNIKRELERLQKTVFDLREDNIKLRQTLIDNDFIIGGDLVDRPGVNETAAKFLKNIKTVADQTHEAAEELAAKLVREIRGQKMIEITVEKFREANEKKVRLLTFKGKEAKELPKEYKSWNSEDQGASVVFEYAMCVRPAKEDLEKWDAAFGEGRGFGITLFMPNDVLTIEQWDLLRKTISKAGKRLKQINDKIRNEWSGKKVYKW